MSDPDFAKVNNYKQLEHDNTRLLFSSITVHISGCLGSEQHNSRPSNGEMENYSRNPYLNVQVASVFQFIKERNNFSQTHTTPLLAAQR